MEDLLDELGPLYATPLDRDRPLWEAYFAGPLAGGRSAVFLKLHHCLMDGVGGTRLLTGLMGARRDAAATPPELPPLAAPSLTLPARVGRAVAHDAGELVATVRLGASLLADTALHPLGAVDRIARGLRGVLGIGRELAGTRADSPIHGHRSLSRRLATLEMSLADIGAVQKLLGATNNDVLLTVVGGALHRWHARRGADVRELRALVPVNIRGGDEDRAGNRLALLAIALPVGEPDPIRRLRIVQERMGRVKRDRRATLYPVVANLVRALPAPIAAGIVGQQMRRANLTCTNVPGPTATCWVAGHAIEALYAFAPMVGDHPVAIAAFSYRDTVYVGLDVDPLAMGDVAAFRDAFAESYAEVVGLVPAAGNDGRAAEAVV
jgi:WS/DGAT/MGAT family acyltransferase